MPTSLPEMIREVTILLILPSSIVRMVTATHENWDHETESQ